MSRVGLDLSKFKKIKEDKKSAILQHPEGHKIMIAKHVISSGLKDQLEKLPMHLAEGTPDKPIQGPNASYDPSLQNAQSDESQNQPNASYQPQPAQPSIVINNTPASQPPPQQPQQVAEAQPVQDQRFNPVNQTSPLPAQQNSPQNDPYGSAAYSNVSKEGLQNQIQGINETATAQGAQNQAVAQEQLSGANAQQQQLDAYTGHVNDMRSEYHNFIQDYQNQHIDPQHYFNSLGTGGNIATGIGLILGGMSGGLTHQGNPALDFLNKQIDRDIQAQQSEMGKKQNLLTANLQQFGNERDAVNMTTAMQRGIVANKMEATALKTGNPLLIARAKQAAGQLELQNNQLFAQMAVRQSLAGGQSSNQPGKQAAQQLPPSDQVRMLGMTNIMPNEDQKKAYEELAKSQETEGLRSQMLDSYNDLNKQFMAGIFSPADRASAVQAIAGKLAKVSEGRFNLEESKQQIDAFLPRRFEGSQTTKNKLPRMNNFLDGLIQTPVLDAYHIQRPSIQQPIDAATGKSKVAESAPILPK